MTPSKLGFQVRDDEVVRADWICEAKPDAPSKAVIGLNVKSTASVEFDPKERLLTGALSQVELLDIIADHLSKGDEPHIVIQIHGFNNPPDVSAVRYQQGLATVEELDRPSGMIFLGYDWPSERAGAPGFALSVTPLLLWSFMLLLSLLSCLCWGGSSFAAHSLRLSLPINLGSYVCFASFSVLVAVGVALKIKEPLSKVGKTALVGMFIPLLVPALAVVLLFTIVVVLLLRFIVYFRDQYRATHYGVVDLVTLLRELDALVKHRFSNDPIRPGRPIKLSIIGHSMGAFVTVNLVRILSDVFDPNSLPSNPDPDPEKLQRIGNTFKLENLVLVSPDLPTETVLSGRSNFVASAIHRFPRRYLFSNEADEVVNLIAGAGHSFSLPYRTPNFGVRLANLCLKRGTEDYRIQPIMSPWSASVWTTRQTLESLDPGTSPFAECFTIVDCTDALDEKTIWRTIRKTVAVTTTPKMERVLSPNLGWPCRRANGHLNQLGHVMALMTYIWKYDLHSGYFDAEYVRKSIFLSACSTVGWTPNDTDLRKHQIAVLPPQRSNDVRACPSTHDRLPETPKGATASSPGA